MKGPKEGCPGAWGGGGAGGAEGGGKARPYGAASRAQARSREQWDVTSGSAGVGGAR